jgi:hypothetical protein
VPYVLFIIRRWFTTGLSTWLHASWFHAARESGQGPKLHIEDFLILAVDGKSFRANFKRNIS